MANSTVQRNTDENVSNPVYFHRRKKLLQLPGTNKIHKFWDKLDLLICLLSGDRLVAETFRITLPTSCSHHGDRTQQNNTGVTCESGKNFCNRRKINIFCTNVNNVLAFLAELFENNIGYLAINTAKSAISNVVILTDSEHVSVGNQPLIKRFMKGVFNQKPSLPRYKSVWDVSEVFKWFQKNDIDDINLKLLTLKTVLLLALLSGQRVQTLQALSINRIKLYDSSVEFHIETLLKLSKPGRHLSVINLSSYQDRQLCVVTHLHKYISATRYQRKSEILLISYQKPHGPVTTDSIARWLKTAQHS